MGQQYWVAGLVGCGTGLLDWRSWFDASVTGGVLVSSTQLDEMGRLGFTKPINNDHQPPLPPPPPLGLTNSSLQHFLCLPFSTLSSLHFALHVLLLLFFAPGSTQFCSFPILHQALIKMIHYCGFCRCVYVEVRKRKGEGKLKRAQTSAITAKSLLFFRASNLRECTRTRAHTHTQ